MARELYLFNRAAEKVEEIATSLTNIARTSFDARAATIDAEKRFAHMIDSSRRYPETDRMIKAEVARVQKESEKALEAEAITLVMQLPDAEKQVHETFNDVRPHRNVSSSVEVLLSKERWEKAKALLESGRSIAEVISNSDLPTILAIEEFATDYLYAQSRPSTLVEPAADINAIRRSVDIKIRTRMAELVDGEDKAALEAVHRAQGFIEIAWVYAKHLQLRFSGFQGSTGALEIGVTAAYIRRDYGIDPKPAEERKRINAAVSTEASNRLNRLQRWGDRVQTA